MSVLFWQNSKNSNNLCVSFPKTGRTWLRVLLDNLDIDLEYSHWDSNHIKQIPYRVWRIKWLRSLPKVVNKKILFLYRDPRDTVVSGYFQCKDRLKNFDGDLSTFIRNDCHGLGKIAVFYESWFRIRRLTNIHYIAYEDLHFDPVNTIKGIGKFFGKELDEKAINSALEISSFDKMQEKEKNNSFGDKYGASLKLINPDNPNSLKVRRGKVGGYRDYFSDDDLKYANKVIERYRLVAKLYQPDE